MDPSEYTSKQQIDEIYARLQARFASLATQSLEYRLYNLKQLGYLVKDNEYALTEALRGDLDRSGFEAALEDLFVVYNDVDLAVKRVAEWMKDESRMRDTISGYGAMDNRVTKQPKGVALIIGPWNYPIQCVLAPLIGAISAGCPAIVKPSELAPNCARILCELIPKYLDTEAYAFVCGSVDETSHLLEKRWGHILFTGSTRVGKIVAAAAAKTLTPTTLELGGKSPVIVSECANLEIMAKRFLSMKSIGAGQVCVSPDYILCPKNRVDELISVLTQKLKKHWPNSPHPDSFLHNPAYSAQLTRTYFDRQMGFLQQAEREGKLVHRGEVDEKSRRIGLSIVKCSPGAVDEENLIVHEEIFGSVIPIIPIDSLEAAIKYINDRPNPLSLYVCATNKSVFEKVKRETMSGAITYNDFVIATTARTLPFGGVGDSGWGSYRGYDGFRTFTHFKATLKVPLFIEPIMTIRYNPTSKVKQFIMRKLFCVETPYNRPTSVEGERGRLIRKKVQKWALSVIFVLAASFFGSKLAVGRGLIGRA